MALQRVRERTPFPLTCYVVVQCKEALGKGTLYILHDETFMLKALTARELSIESIRHFQTIFTRFR